MAQLAPEQLLAPAEQQRLQELEEELQELLRQRTPLAEKMRRTEHLSAEKTEVDRLNVEIVRVSDEIKKLREKNPLLAKNQPGYQE